MGFVLVMRATVDPAISVPTPKSFSSHREEGFGVEIKYFVSL
jgi:hypothetical protein